MRLLQMIRFCYRYVSSVYNFQYLDYEVLMFLMKPDNVSATRFVIRSIIMLVCVLSLIMGVSCVYNFAQLVLER